MNQPQLLDNLVKLINSYELPDDVGFGRTMLPLMIVCNFDGKKWGELLVQEYGPLQIDPAAKVLHYAQEIFEGLKAYKNEAGEINLFRADMNAKRFNLSADRMAMPSFPEEKFIESVRFLTSLCHKHIPTKIGSSLYFRPFMIATEPTLGVRPSDTYTYVLIASPADNYFSNPNVKVMIERDNCRATPGGTGYAKAGGNYAASLKAFKKTKEIGCDQTLWLDGASKTYVEELSGMNFFAVVGDELQTPSLTDTILAGVTRDSLLKLASKFGLKPVEKKIAINDLLKEIEEGKCTEAFACGTAAVLTPISILHDNGKDYKLKFPDGNIGPSLKEELLLIQRGEREGLKDWTLSVEPYSLED